MSCKVEQGQEEGNGSSEPHLPLHPGEFGIAVCTVCFHLVLTARNGIAVCIACAREQK